MHSAILGTAGYALLFSSFVSLVFLLRKNLKRCVGSSLHMLVMSDVLSSVITGILLIFNQYRPVAGPFDDEGTMKNRTWMEFIDQENSRFFLSSKQHLDNDSASVCKFRDVVSHYAMFLFPFANAFISLLSFAARSNSQLKRVTSECTRLVDLVGGEKNPAEESSEKLNYLRKRDESSVTAAVGIAGQWIVPIFISIVLSFAGNEKMESLERSRDIGCIYGMNFPFENCYTNENNVRYFNRNVYTTPVANDYMAEIDSTNFLEKNTTDMHEAIVSMIYHIVGTAMNSTGIEGGKTTFYEPTQLMNITNFMKAHTEETIDSEGKDYEKSTEIINFSEEYLENESTTFVNSKGELDPEEEAELFESLLKNSSNILHEEFGLDEETPETEKSSEVDSNIDDGSQFEKDDIELETNLNESPKVTNNDTVQSELETDEDILADIMKKIQAAQMSTQLRGREKFRYAERNENGRSYKNSNQLGDLAMAEENVESMPTCMKNQCFVSTRFLKIHLLVLVFFVYFVPIFLSAILQTRATYKCRNIRERLRPNELGKEKKSAGRITKENMENSSGPSGWFPTVSPNENEIASGSCEDLVCSSKFQGNGEKVMKASAIQIPEENTAESNQIVQIVKDEICEMEKLSEIFQTYFLIAVVSWTPIFLELLAKVFLCMDTIEWLVEACFFGATLFGITRNALNLRMIRTREIIRNDCKKENSVFPSP